MIYGMYLSATGLITNSHQQDVIANNLANSETSGFKRSVALLEQRKLEAQVSRTAGRQSKLYDRLSGGQLLAPTSIDLSQGTMETSSNPMDVAISGKGFLAVRDKGGETRLTRAGELMIDREGNLITAQGHTVLDTTKQPIKLQGIPTHELSFGEHGEIRRGRETLATLGMFDPSDPTALRPLGENMFALTGDATMVQAKGLLLSGTNERSNVDPAIELTKLMETQRLLETNANMIKYQDTTLAKLVNEVGKIS
jgi:flagellar basal body rod protein FlgG